MKHAVSIVRSVALATQLSKVVTLVLDAELHVVRHVVRLVVVMQPLPGTDSHDALQVPVWCR